METHPRKRRIPKMSDVKSPTKVTIREAARLAGWIDDTLVQMNQTQTYIITPNVRLGKLIRSHFDSKKTYRNKLIGMLYVVPDIKNASGAQITLCVGIDGDIGELFDKPEIKHQPYFEQSKIFLDYILVNWENDKPYHGNITALVIPCINRRITMASVLKRVQDAHETNPLFQKVPCKVLTYHRLTPRDPLFLPTTAADVERQFTQYA